MQPAKKKRMETSRLSSKGQVTIPQSVRDFLSLQSGDQVVYLFNGNQIILKKTEPLDIDYIKSLESTLSEWNSEGDNDAYNDL